MRRRDFLKVAAGSAAAWPLASHAQQPATPVIGFLHLTSLELTRENLASFRRGLGETGYIEDRNVAIEYRWAEGRNDQLPALAAELVRRQVSVIVATTPYPAFAAKAATTTIPIAFIAAQDPVKLGLVASLARPGGNLTGVSMLTGELAAKRLEFLRELVPGAVRVAAFINPNNPGADNTLKELDAAARAMGLQVQVFTTSTSREIDAAFATLCASDPMPSS